MPTVSARIAAAGLMLVLGAVALAHTSAVGTTPKSGSILDKSPSTIEIRFKAPVRITSVVVHQEGKPERTLTASPNASSATFKIDNPQLEPGHSQVRWIALSQDGHVVKGVIDLTVKPAAQ